MKYISADEPASGIHATPSCADQYLLGEYQTELQRQWNDFLINQYSSTDALRQSWGPGDAAGTELLSLQADGQTFSPWFELVAE